MAYEYLTEDWAAAAAAAVNADETFKSVAGSIKLTVQQEVTGTPSGDVSYVMGIADGEAFARIGTIENADLTVSQDYETAKAIAKGELNLQNAFMQGKVKVTGNLALAMQYQPQLQSLEGALAKVEVDYP